MYSQGGKKVMDDPVTLSRAMARSELYLMMEKSLERFADCSIAIAHHHGFTDEQAVMQTLHACASLCAYSGFAPSEDLRKWTLVAVTLAMKKHYNIIPVLEEKSDTIISLHSRRRTKRPDAG